MCCNDSRINDRTPGARFYSVINVGRAGMTTHHEMSFVSYEGI